VALRFIGILALGIGMKTENFYVIVPPIFWTAKTIIKDIPKTIVLYAALAVTPSREKL
jgi:hypothetical protein